MNNEVFNYTYSAKQQEEVAKIRKKYEEQDKSEDNLTKLRKLDAHVTQKAEAISIALGTLGALILGFGMSLIMTDISEILGLGGTELFIGIPIGIIGIVLVAAAYPAYNSILKKERKKAAPEIIRLSDELSK